MTRPEITVPRLPKNTAPSRALRLVDDPHPHPHPLPSLAPAWSGIQWAKGYRTRLLVTDIVTISVAVAGAFLINLPSLAAAPPHAYSTYWALAVLVALLWVVLLSVFRTRDSRVLSVGLAEYKRIVSSSTMTFGLLAISFVAMQADSVRWYFVVAFPAGLIWLLAGRWLWRRWLIRQGHNGHAMSRVIVVGQRDDVEYVIGQIDRKSGAAYSVVGVVTAEQPDAEVTPISHTMRGARGDIPTSRDIDDVAAMAAKLGADSVIVAGSPSGRADFVRDLAWDLEGTATSLILATSLANVAGPRIHLRPIEGLPLIHVEIPQFEGGKHVLKRAFDIVVSGIAIVLLSPLLLLLAVVVRLDSSGPALFMQERVGRDGRTFMVMKFRSMVTTATADLAGLLDSNNGAGVLFKMKNDPRVTRVGRILRKYSLDELPQLWNIFVGDMSIVGPRPPLPREVSGYETHVHRRLYIRPGLTGMWQVGGRSDLSWEESVQLDLYYVENWSLIGDIAIMWRTLRVLVHPVGAY